MTGYNSQATKANYSIQFETDDRSKYERVEAEIRNCIDNRPQVQPIVRTVDEIIDAICSLSCPTSEKLDKCIDNSTYRETDNCNRCWKNWLLGKDGAE